MTVVLLVVGLAFLVAGAELLVRGASRLAAALSISPLVIGLTVVAFGTSAPELAVSVQAALDGRAGIALGNVVGSNIFNVLLILGLSALIAPLAVSRQLIRVEVPYMIGVSVLLAVLAWNGRVSRVEGAALAILGIVYTAFQIRQSGVLENRNRNFSASKPLPWSSTENRISDELRSNVTVANLSAYSGSVRRYATSSSHRPFESSSAFSSKPMHKFPCSIAFTINSSMPTATESGSGQASESMVARLRASSMVRIPGPILCRVRSR